MGAHSLWYNLILFLTYDCTVWASVYAFGDIVQGCLCPCIREKSFSPLYLAFISVSYLNIIIPETGVGQLFLK